jgi:SMODS and SLOG-associating 2TM effector domain 1
VESAAAWVPVLTTIGAALLAHAAAAHYSDDAIAFTRTADRLEYLRAARGVGQAETVTDADFVAACEDAILTENKGWMAKWSAEEASAS